MAQLDRFVAVDVETTGLFANDRVVEIATVTLDGTGQVVDEWDTLVNPERDVGPTHIHGITASMVSAAPCFSEVAPALSERIHGSVLIAHNLPFDARMLANEYERLDAAFAPGEGICTLSLCGERLDAACATHGIDQERGHRALSDARAAALLYTALGPGQQAHSPASVDGISLSYRPRTLRRDTVASVAAPDTPYLVRLARSTSLQIDRDSTLRYLDLLDWVLADLYISPQEWRELKMLAADLGMSDEDIESAHLTYMKELIGAALRDGIVTDEEYGLITRAAKALRVPESVVEDATSGRRVSPGSVVLSPGLRVCFTGTAVAADGSAIARGDLEKRARQNGLEPVSDVTKKKCDLLIAADPSSASGKAKKARKYGIPVVNGARDFVLRQPQPDVDSARRSRAQAATTSSARVVPTIRSSAASESA